MTHIAIEGNLTVKPELAHSPTGTAYARFTVAVNDRRFHRDSGEWVTRGTVFHDVVAFAGLAENLATLERGTSVIVIGQMVDNSYIGEDDRKIVRTRIEASNIGPSLRYATATVTKNSRRSEPAMAG